MQQSFAKAKQNLVIPVELEGFVQRQLGVTDSDKVVTRPSDLQTHTTRASPQFPPLHPGDLIVLEEKIKSLLLRRNILLQAQHLPGVLNSIADGSQGSGWTGQNGSSPQNCFRKSTISWDHSQQICLPEGYQLNSQHLSAGS